MKPKPYLLTCAFIFFLVAAAHLSRLVLRWDVVIAGWSVPHWVSIPGLLVPGILSFCGLRLASRAS